MSQKSCTIRRNYHSDNVKRVTGNQGNRVTMRFLYIHICVWVCGWNTDTKSPIRKINGYLGYHKGKYPENRIKSTKNRVTELWLQNCKNGYVGYGG